MIAKTLLDAKASPNVQNDKGETPLHCATSYRNIASHPGGNPNSVRVLLEGGVDPGIATKNGDAPLDYAIFNHKRTHCRYESYRLCIEILEGFGT